MKETFTVVLPVITLILGFFLNKFDESYKIRKKRKVQYRYIKDLLNLVHNQIKLQIESIDECIIRIKDFSNNDLNISLTTGDYVKRLQKIDDGEFYSAFLLRKRKVSNAEISNFTTVIKIIDYYAVIVPHLLEANKVTIKEINDSLAKWNEAHKTSFIIYNEIRTETLYDDLVKKFEQIIKKFGDKNGIECQDLTAAKNELIEPLIEVCKSSSDQRARRLFYPIQECKLQYRQLVSTRELHNDLLKKAVEDMRSSNTKLEKIIKSL